MVCARTHWSARRNIILENIEKPETKSRSLPNHKLQMEEEKFYTNIKICFKVNIANIWKGGHNQIQGPRLWNEDQW